MPHNGRVGLSRTVARGLLAVGALAFGCGRSAVVEPSLSATCAALPASGPAPLLVGFSLNVAGAHGNVTININYGDGSNGTDVAAVHRYADPGSYTAAFTVTTSSQSALCTTPVRVEAAAAVAPQPVPPPNDGPNQPPDAVFRTTPDPGPGGGFTGRPPLTIQFNLCTSSDPEHDPLRFRMDFQGDGDFELSGPTGADCRRSFSYPAGSFSPRICVTDLSSGLDPLHPDQCRTYSVRLRN